MPDEMKNKESHAYLGQFLLPDELTFVTKYNLWKKSLFFMNKGQTTLYCMDF